MLIDPDGMSYEHFDQPVTFRVPAHWISRNKSRDLFPELSIDEDIILNMASKKKDPQKPKEEVPKAEPDGEGGYNLPEVVVTAERPKPAKGNIALPLPWWVVLGSIFGESAATLANVAVAIPFIPLAILMGGDTRPMEMSQHGKNRGHLEPQELERLLAKPKGTLTSEEKMKLKKHGKNDGKIHSRQSKDKK